MNDRIEQLLNESTVECMGVNQLNPRLFAMAIIRECANIADRAYPYNGYYDILQHFGVNNDTSITSR